jgi:hypothetical protein
MIFGGPARRSAARTAAIWSRSSFCSDTALFKRRSDILARSRNWLSPSMTISGCDGQPSFSTRPWQRARLLQPRPPSLFRSLKGADDFLGCLADGLERSASISAGHVVADRFGLRLALPARRLLAILLMEHFVLLCRALHWGCLIKRIIKGSLCFRLSPA